MVIDDGLDSSHPDLAPNFSAEISHDFNGEDEDVSPRYRYWGHSYYETLPLTPIISLSQ